jgi:hypothetical protein
MLRDIRACVEDEPATGPWSAVRHSPTQFAIFEAFPDIAGRDAHVAGGGGDIFRDVERMNAIPRRPAHVQKVDILSTREFLPKANGSSELGRVRPFGDPPLLARRCRREMSATATSSG